MLAGLCVAFAFVSCSNDEDGIRFTKDEIVEGDILTGKQVPLVGNTLQVYTTEQGSVNVQGAKGNIHADSSDEGIAAASCVNGPDQKVIVQAIAVGCVDITVTDSEGNAASFQVKVADVNEAWVQRGIFVVHGAKMCVVAGVSKEDSTAIAEDAIAKDKDVKYVVAARPFFPWSLYRLRVYDKDDICLAEGFLELGNTQEDRMTYRLYADDHQTLLQSYVIDKAKGQYLVKDLTGDYRARYPAVSAVELFIPYKKLR